MIIEHEYAIPTRNILGAEIFTSALKRELKILFEDLKCDLNGNDIFSPSKAKEGDCLLSS